MIKETIYSIVRDVFADPTLAVSENTTAADVSGWDSFNHMNLIMRVEEEFGVSFSTDEIGSLGRVGDLVETIITKTSNK